MKKKFLKNERKPLRLLTVLLAAAITAGGVGCTFLPNEEKEPSTTPGQQIVTPESSNKVNLTDFSEQFQKYFPIFTEKVKSLSVQELEKLLYEDWRVDDSSYYKQDELCKLFEVLESEKFNTDFGKTGFNIEEIQNPDMKQKSPTYISVNPDDQAKFYRANYNSNSVWGVTNGKFINEGYDTFICDGIVVLTHTETYNGVLDFSTGKYIYGTFNVPHDILVNFGDYVIQCYFEYDENTKIDFGSIYKLTDRPMEEYFKEYGIENLSIVGWVQDKLDLNKTKDDMEK